MGICLHARYACVCSDWPSCSTARVCVCVSIGLTDHTDRGLARFGLTNVRTGQGRERGRLAGKIMQASHRQAGSRVCVCVCVCVPRWTK